MTDVGGRSARTTLVGKVVSSKMKDTIVVRDERKVKHPLYGKYVRRVTKYVAHDAGNTAREGDVVEIMQTRPISKTKRWRLVKVVRRSHGDVAHADVDIAGAVTPVAAESAVAAETNAPAAETEAPAAETEAPAAETEAPAAETKAPAAETKAPAAETKAPDAEEANS